MAYGFTSATVTGCNVTIGRGQGDITYANVSVDSVARQFTVGASSGKVAIPKATPLGTYALTIRVTAQGTVDYVPGSTTVSYRVVVTKASNPITAEARRPSLSVTYRPTAAIVTATNLSTTKSIGALTYTNASTDTTAQRFGVDATTGKVTIPKATRAGTYTVKVKVKAAGNKNHKAGSQTVSYKVVVTKAANPITVTPVARAVSYETLKSKSVTVAKPLTVSGSIGTKTYVRAQNSNYFTIDASTGKVTARKGTPKGTYSLKVRVTAAGGPNYKPGSKTVTCKVTVR